MAVAFNKFVKKQWSILHEQCQRLTEYGKDDNNVEQYKKYYTDVFLPSRIEYVKGLYEHYDDYPHQEVESSKFETDVIVSGFDGGFDDDHIYTCDDYKYGDGSDDDDDDDYDDGSDDGGDDEEEANEEANDGGGDEEEANEEANDGQWPC